MSTLQLETLRSTYALSSFIKPILEGIGYAFAALALYAIPMGAAYFIFQTFFNL